MAVDLRAVIVEPAEDAVVVDVEVLVVVEKGNRAVAVSVAVVEEPKAVSAEAAAVVVNVADLEEATLEPAVPKAVAVAAEVVAADDATFRTRWTRKVSRNCPAPPQPKRCRCRGNGVER